jgi:hypothetical protein
MSGRQPFLIATLLSAGLCLCQAPSSGRQTPTTADQVIDNYVQAIGGSEKIASITNLSEQGELSGDLGEFIQPFAPPKMSKDQGSFEFYFKAPNLRFYLLHQKNQVNSLRGCDGKTSWYIGPDAVPHEFQPKLGSEYECETGYTPMPRGLRAPNRKLQLKGKKKLKIGWRGQSESRILDHPGPTLIISTQKAICCCGGKASEAHSPPARDLCTASSAPTPTIAMWAESSWLSW